PDARVRRVSGGWNPELGERDDDRVLQGPEIPMQVASVAREVENRIADELARAMEGDVTPALDLEDVDCLGTQDVGGVGGATQCHHRRVLEQQEEVVRQPPIDPSLGEGSLPP